MFNNVLSLPINMEEIPVTQVHFADADNPKGQSVWMIESHVHAETSFWEGYFFDKDITKAVRFARKQDADAVRKYFSPLKGFKVIQHVWL